MRSKISKFITGFAIFFCTAIFSATFFGSIDYIGRADAAESDVSVTISPVLSMRVTKDNTDITELNLDVDPLPTGRFKKDNLSVLISTSNTTGYTLTMANNDDTTSLDNTNTTITDKINSITTLPTETTNTTTEANFPVNSWGYGLGDPTSSAQTFARIPTSSAADTLKTTTGTTTEDETKVTFATKVDTTLTSGTYQDTVVFSATPNYVPVVAGLTTITNMQDMTATVCSDSEVGDTNTLTDSRDGNTYTIRKMEDGKCWMTQNLRLGTTPSGSAISSALTLTPTDSNVSTNFTLPTSAIQSSGSTAWGSSTPTESQTNTLHVYNNGNSWIQPTSSGNNSTVNTSGTPDVQSKYIGNYYNWYTATATTGTYSMASGNATSSICPKGWKLPTGGDNSDFTSLTNALVGITTNSSSVPTQSFTLQSSPNHVVLGGYYGYSSGVVNQGSHGYWWSSSAYSATHAWNMLLYTSYVDPQNNSHKAYGFSIRCVAQ